MVFSTFRDFLKWPKPSFFLLRIQTTYINTYPGTSSEVDLTAWTREFAFSELDKLLLQEWNDGWRRSSKGRSTFAFLRSGVAALFLVSSHMRFRAWSRVTRSYMSVGHISGCHINPAVTLGLFIMGRIGLLKSVLYIPAQCAGAVAGAALLKYMVPDPLVKTLGATVVNNVITPGQGVAVEAAITAVLLLVVGAVTDPDRTDLANAAPIAIGLAITCCHIFAVPITGSSMNPARALGPAAIQSVWDNHWVYWVGPLLGGAVAGAVYRLVFKAPKDENSYDL